MVEVTNGIQYFDSDIGKDQFKIFRYTKYKEKLTHKYCGFYTP